MFLFNIFANGLEEGITSEDGDVIGCGVIRNKSRNNKIWYNLKKVQGVGYLKKPVQFWFASAELITPPPPPTVLTVRERLLFWFWSTHYWKNFDKWKGYKKRGGRGIHDTWGRNNKVLFICRFSTVGTTIQTSWLLVQCTVYLDHS